MKRNTMIAIAVASLIPLAGTALANEGYDKDKGKAGASFDSLDTNRDGRISRAEAAVDATIVWSSADANGDGYLDTSEYKKAMKSKSSDSTTTPQPQSAPMPEETAPQGETTTPPADTETPRQ